MFCLSWHLQIQRRMLCGAVVFWHFAALLAVGLQKSCAAEGQTAAATQAVESAKDAALPLTYCNPLNLDYGYCPIPQYVTAGKHRTTADPVLVPYAGDYYLFSTNQWGYWWSSDLHRWTFVPRKFLKPEHTVYDELCAPALLARADGLYVLGSTVTPNFPLYRSPGPKSDTWTEAASPFPLAAWDPALFADDDGKVYLIHGSNQTKPLQGQELNPATWAPVGASVDLIRLHPEVHGWERFGEAQDQTFLNGFMEGGTLNKHQGKYYLQYAAPGTEFSGYADGVYVGDHPLGPYRYQPHNPFAYKPGGFARGAGHGATFQDHQGAWWHVGTIILGVKNNFERRLGMWPAAFDAADTLYCNTAYGDYPHYLGNPKQPAAGTVADPQAPKPGQFTGWMLLNYAKPVLASSWLPGHPPNLAVDEDLCTYWSAQSDRPGEFFQTDLGAICQVRAVQINYADEAASLMGKQPGLTHQYTLEASLNGDDWTLVVDKSKNQQDVPHDYLDLGKAVSARYLRITNVRVPTGLFALSGLRVFGAGPGQAPDTPEELLVLRGEHERRNAWIKWKQSSTATGYVIRFGVDPNALYSSVLVYGNHEYWLRALDGERGYFFSLEAFNEAGISPRTAVLQVP